MVLGCLEIPQRNIWKRIELICMEGAILVRNASLLAKGGSPGRALDPARNSEDEIKRR